MKGSAAFLSSETSREPSSTIRGILRSGVGRLQEFPLIEVAKTLFAAIMVGGMTLELYKHSLENFDEKKQKEISSDLK